jgi:GH15 family glucan-1,4-alpha-glucosidase
VLEYGWSPKLRSFRRCFGEDALDASTLLVASTGLLPPGDPRVLGTIDAVSRKLTCGRGLVYRYDGEDGLPPGEGAFLACGYWLVEALALSGRRGRAERIFESLNARGGALGLLSEELDCKTGALLGNYPQSLTHMAQIDAGLALIGRLKV